LTEKSLPLLVTLGPVLVTTESYSAPEVGNIRPGPGFFSYRNLEEMMAERGLKLDHSIIARWLLESCTSAKPADSI
jgi:hypothetical protein